MKKVIIFLILTVLLVNCNNSEQNEVEVASVKHGVFILDVTEEGEVDATSAITIYSPSISWRFGQMKVNMIVEDGEKVQKGDTVIMFDQSDVMKAKMDRQAELEIAFADLEKLKATHASRINELDANLRITEISHQISEINFEQSSYEADITRKEIKLNLEKAKITLEKAKAEIKNQKKIQKEEVQQDLLKIKQLQVEVDEAQNTMDDMIVTSPAQGIAILTRNWSTNNKWQVGDQTWSANPLINLPDLSELMVKAEINEVDIAKIKLGKPVEIKLDAFSDTVFEGRVVKVANLAGNKNRNSKIKVFPIEILIKGTSDLLMPGMSVSCKINVDMLDDKTFIPLEALFRNGAEEYVYIKTGGSFKKRIVETGLSNNDYITIEKGLEKDQKIALSDPFINLEEQNPEN